MKHIHASDCNCKLTYDNNALLYDIVNENTEPSPPCFALRCPRHPAKRSLRNEVILYSFYALPAFSFSVMF